MSRAIVLGAALLAAAGSLAACNQNTAPASAPVPVTEPAPVEATPAPGTANEAVSAVQDATAGAVGVITAEMTTTTKGFSAAAAQSDMYEVAAGKIALQRSKSPAIKNFAKQMIAAHSMTSDKLKMLVKGITDIQLPTMLNSRHQGLIDNLIGAKDEDFDSRYLSQQDNAHQEALILFRGYSKDGDNAQIKQFAADTTPVIQMHLDMAKSLDKSRADNTTNPTPAP